MDIKSIDGAMLQKMFLAATKNLDAKKEWINELNVFPVPDGDTGTNMTLTIMSAAKEVESIEHPTMENLSKAISSGSLRGARGNSGVILSQLFRGFTKVIRHTEVIDAGVLSEACGRAVETAYKAVMKPKEGTILTVARGIAEKTAELALETDDLTAIIEEAVKYGDEVLKKTPDMLPVLKQAGVVDSGGQGLMQVLKGALDALLGRETDRADEPNESGEGTDESLPDTGDRYAYIARFTILTGEKTKDGLENELKAAFESIGDLVTVSVSETYAQAGLNTDDPGLALQKAIAFGALTDIQIENTRLDGQTAPGDRGENAALKNEAQLQAEDEKKQEAALQTPPKKNGFIAVSAGDGLREIFKSLRVDRVIEGGQTMNPSTEDLLNAVESVNAETVFILPNNKNIILAAQQAEKLAEDKQVVVIPSQTIPQGIAALISFTDDGDADANREQMMEGMENIKSGEVTYAVRDTVIGDQTIRQGDIMGLGDEGLLSVGATADEAMIKMIDSLADEDDEIISIYYGNGISGDDAESLREKVEDAFPDYEVEIYDGGQPVYYYIVSVE